MRSWIGSIFTLALLVSPAYAVDQLPADAFGRLPNVSSVDISPDGRHLAMIAGNTREERSIIVTSLETGEAVRIPSGEERAVQVNWLSNDRFGAVFFKYTEVFGGVAEFNRPRLLVMDRDGSDRVEINPPAPVVDYLLDDPNHVIMVAGIRQEAEGRRTGEMIQRTDIYRVNINTGNARPIQIGTEDTTGWILGPSGEPRMRIDTQSRTVRAASARGRFEGMEAEKYFYYAKPPGSNRWSLIHERDVRSNDDEEERNSFFVAGLTDDEMTAYLVGRVNGADLTGLYTMDLTSGEIEGPLFVPDGFDLGGVARDPYTRKALGYVWTEGERKRVFFDEMFEGIHTSLEEAFPDSEIALTSWSADRSRFVVRVQGGTVIDNYYLYDRAAGQLRMIARAYPEIPDAAANPVQWIDYQARDGLRIQSYLTLPRDREAENLPTIVLPHGGPEARDFPGFDWWSQFLAHRGYAVLQPQFRHSEGFGRNFVEAGYGEWGRAMNHDLEDGVEWLVEQGITDPEKICIFGWSYGGYATLAGLAFSPDLYRCGVAGAPVSDVISFLEWSEEVRGGVRSPIVEYWNRAIGEHYADRSGVIAISPARHAANVKAPLLLIHGDIDLIVPISQSEIMARAMDEAGKPYEFTVLEDENHNLLIGETRMKMLEELDRFLAIHNPAR